MIPSNDTRFIGKVSNFMTPVRPSDMDAYGHMNNAVALQLFELGRARWAVDYDFFYPEHTAAFVVHVSIDYKKEVFMENVIIQTELLSATYFKLVFAQHILSDSHGSTHCVSGLIEVSFVNKNTKAPIRIKDIMRRIESND